MTKQRRLFLNEKQIEILQAKQKDRTAIWGRGTGKSHNMGISQYTKAQVMPRSKGFISSTTFTQLLTKTWPGIEASWQKMGWKEGRDYVFGIQPPKHFDSPIAKVKKFGNTVHWKNGRLIEFLSMDRPDLARGGSYDDGEIDECLLVPQEHINIVLWPSIRGNLHRFSYTHWHQSMIKYSSMPWKSTGLYLLDFKRLAAEDPEEYFYSEATAYDNIKILGEAGIERLRKKLTPQQFAMEVMNQHMIISKEAFYQAFDDEVHTYQPKYLYGEDDKGRDTVVSSLDVNKDALLDTAWDFGGWFSCCAIFQENKGNEERMVDALYAKDTERVGDIVTKLCDKYHDHRNKTIRMWGEPHGHDKNQLMKESTYDFLVAKFKERGWRAIIMAPRALSRQQKERRIFMATIMEERSRGYPQFRMNAVNCEWCKVAIQGAGTNPDGSKNKSTEKDREFPQEHATHVTDAIDYYYDQKWGPRISMGGSTLGQAGSADFI